MANIKKDTLANYGYSFQHKLIISLLTDATFFEQIYDIIEVDYFETTASKWVIGVLLKYYETYKKLPTMEIFKVTMEDEVDDELMRYNIKETLKESYKVVAASDLPFIKERALDFCKNQNLKRAILESVDLLQQRAYDRIKDIIDAAMQAGSDRNIGIDYIEDVDGRFERGMRANPLPTGFPALDVYLDGGLAEGDLGVWIALSGVGKSWMLCALAANAMKAGKKVMFYTLENTAEMTAFRIDSLLTHIPTHNLKYHKADVEKMIKKLPGSLHIKKYPNRGATVSTLRTHYNKLLLFNKEPDVLIIDYGDILEATERFQDNRYREKAIFDGLKGFAGEISKPIWTASQVHRGAEGQDIITTANIAEAFAKVMISDIVISLTRKLEDKVSDTGKIHIAKNRFGKDGITLPAEINFGKGIINIFDTNTKTGIEIAKKMDRGDGIITDLLRKKYKEIKDEE